MLLAPCSLEIALLRACSSVHMKLLRACCRLHIALLSGFTCVARASRTHVRMRTAVEFVSSCSTYCFQLYLLLSYLLAALLSALLDAFRFSCWFQLYLVLDSGLLIASVECIFACRCQASRVE